MNRPVALVTGASQGLGLALARHLVRAGWVVVADARHADVLDNAFADFGAREPGTIVAIPGDVTDPAHRHQLIAATAARGGLALLVNNASDLGATPLPTLARYPLAAFRALLETNVVAPLALTQGLLPQLRAKQGRVVNISSDAAVEPYEGWGGYGASKASLDQLTGVLATEEPTLRVYSFDPGDMRTQMHADALPGDDVADLPSPQDVVPALERLVFGQLPSGRFRTSDLRTAVTR
jgi:NAD(P)-dependent dehydrogenase (short-subunit alcohol dehydrogenase family)